MNKQTEYKITYHLWRIKDVEDELRICTRTFNLEKEAKIFRNKLLEFISAQKRGDKTIELSKAEKNFFDKADKSYGVWSVEKIEKYTKEILD